MRLPLEDAHGRNGRNPDCRTVSIDESALPKSISADRCRTFRGNRKHLTELDPVALEAAPGIRARGSSEEKLVDLSQRGGRLDGGPGFGDRGRQRRHVEGMDLPAPHADAQQDPVGQAPERRSGRENVVVPEGPGGVVELPISEEERVVPSQRGNGKRGIDGFARISEGGFLRRQLQRVALPARETEHEEEKGRRRRRRRRRWRRGAAATIGWRLFHLLRCFICHRNRVVKMMTNSNNGAILNP
mmetsp:Transcript_7934/g.19731  ORF Transcript_7934/g.19731 Transcript_7934/m.19731 type:complete len:244 (+) Transcript_7934:1425-2156(+)